MSTTSTGDEGDTRPSRPVSDDAAISKPKGILAVDGKHGERTRINLRKIQLLGTWNVRSMYLGKLEVVKREMMRCEIPILGISEL